MSEAQKIAEEHWITNHRGPRCVACGWWDPHHSEDTGVAARRHIAEVALRAGWDECLRTVMGGIDLDSDPTPTNPYAA